MPTHSKNHGEEAEDRLETFLKSSYLADFVIRSKTYLRPGAGDGEAADFLLPFGDTLFCIQSKSRQLKSDSTPISAIEIDRLKKRLDQAIKQIPTILEALRLGGLENATNLRGIALPLGKKQWTRLVGIAVLNTAGPTESHTSTSLDLYGGLCEVQGITVHSFLLEDLEVVIRELDTLGDLLHYLTVREHLKKREILNPLTCERELLAAFVSKYATIDECLSGQVSHLIIEDGAWDALQRTAVPAIRERERRRARSRIFDDILEQVCRCVDFAPPASELGIDMPFPAATPDDYYTIAQDLAQWKRADRIGIAQKVVEKVHKADSDPLGFRHVAIQDRQSKLTLVFVASRLPRADRLRILFNVARVAYVHFNASVVVGIGLPSLLTKGSSFDFIRIPPNEVFDDEIALRASARQLFVAPRRYTQDQWGNAD
jgi:hypothetical protein